MYFDLHYLHQSECHPIRCRVSPLEINLRSQGKCGLSILFIEEGNSICLIILLLKSEFYILCIIHFHYFRYLSIHETLESFHTSSCSPVRPNLAMVPNHLLDLHQAYPVGKKEYINISKIRMQTKILTSNEGSIPSYTLTKCCIFFG